MTGGARASLSGDDLEQLVAAAFAAGYGRAVEDFHQALAADRRRGRVRRLVGVVWAVVSHSTPSRDG